jgi:hypothetical protein
LSPVIHTSTTTKRKLDVICDYGSWKAEMVMMLELGMQEVFANVKSRFHLKLKSPGRKLLWTKFKTKSYMTFPR